MSHLLVRRMWDDLGSDPPKYPVIPGALLLDDTDAVLLDEATTHVIKPRVSSAAFDWSFALAFCDQLVARDTVEVEEISWTPRARLTIAGERLLREAARSRADTTINYLLLRRAVELAFVAKYVLQEGDHYLVDQDRVLPIDQTSGRIRRDVTPDWLPALQAIHGEPAAGHPVEVHRMEPSVLVRDFAVRSGLSGTVGSDALEYLFGFYMVPIRISPRLPRHAGELPDQVYPTKRAAVRKAVAVTVDAVRAGRPVLIGAHTIPDAQQCYDELSAVDLAGADLRLLTGYNTQDEARVFDSAGEVGTVTVATQLAGRGVDIRLSDPARANGGLLLVGLGRSRLTRHDRQFLGRAGRQGDPFTSVFLCSLEDSFIRAFRVDLVKRLFQGLRIPEDMPIESKVVQRQFEAAQRQYRWLQLRRRRLRLVMDVVDGQLSQEIGDWLRLSQAPAGPEDVAAEYSPVLVDVLAKRFVDTVVPANLNGRKLLTRSQAEQVAVAVTEVLGPVSGFRDHEVIAGLVLGRRGPEVREILRRYLCRVAAESVLANQAARERLALRKREYSEDVTLLNQVYDALQSLKAIQELVRQRLYAHGPAGARVGAEAAPPTTGLDAESGAVRRLVGARTFTLAELAAAATSPLSRNELLELAAFVGSWVDNIRRWHRTGVAEWRMGNRDRSRLAALLVRSPRAAGHWAIKLAWASYLNDRQAIEDGLRRSGLPASRYFRVLTDRLLGRWQRAEAELVPSALSAVIWSRRPEYVEALFLLQDNYLPAPKGSPAPAPALEWRSSPFDTRPDQTRRDDSLIEHFVRYQFPDQADEHAEAQLIRVLSDFLGASPLSILQTSVQIQQRIHEWVSDQRLRGVPERRWRADLEWVKRFVRFLHKRGVVPSYPGVGVWLRVSLQQVRSNLSELRTFLPAVAAAGLVAVLGLLSQVRVRPPTDLPVPVRLLDALVAGGLLSTGALVGPAVAAVAIGSLLVASADGGFRSSWAPRMRLLAAAALVATAPWVIPWPTDDPRLVGALLTLLVMLGIAATFVLSLGMVISLELWAGLQLASLWLCYSVLAAFVPAVIALAGTPVVETVVVFGVAAAVLTASWVIGRTEVSAVSLGTASGPDRPTDGRLVGSTYRVRGAVDFTTYLVAVAMAYSAQQIAAVLPGPSGSSSTVAIVTPFGAYMATILVQVIRVNRRRCSPVAWNLRLSRAGQVPDPTSGTPLPVRLRNARRRSTAIEVSANLAALGIAVGIMRDAWIPGVQLPAALLVVVAAALLAGQGRILVRSLLDLFVLRTPLTAAIVDLPPVPDPPERTPRRRSGAWWFVRRRAIQLTAAVVFLLGLLAKVADAVELGKYVADLFPLRWLG